MRKRLSALVLSALMAPALLALPATAQNVLVSPSNSAPAPAAPAPLLPNPQNAAPTVAAPAADTSSSVSSSWRNAMQALQAKLGKSEAPKAQPVNLGALTGQYIPPDIQANYLQSEQSRINPMQQMVMMLQQQVSAGPQSGESQDQYNRRIQPVMQQLALANTQLAASQKRLTALQSGPLKFDDLVPLYAMQ